ncbi:MAG: sugar transferase [Acidimicrobiia bacterium]
MKRIIDAIVASVLLVVTLPVLLVAVVGCALSLRAWPFFSQTRIGRDGRPFRFVKVRTLPVDAPRYSRKYDLDTDAIPRFCAALRHLKLDELPQLWLVVRGHMSLVGPRPEMPFLNDQFDPGFAEVRSSVLPGCTGLWQIGEHSDGLILEHPEFDRFYIENRSVRLDLWILARTVRLLIPVGRRQFLSLDQLPAWARQRAVEPVPAAHFPVRAVELRPVVDAGRRPELRPVDA